MEINIIYPQRILSSLIRNMNYLITAPGNTLTFKGKALTQWSMDTPLLLRSFQGIARSNYFHDNLRIQFAFYFILTLHFWRRNDGG